MLSLLVFTAQASDEPSAASTPAPPASAAGQPAPKIVPLLGFVLSQIGGMAFKQAVGESPLGLFRKLREQYFDSGKSAATSIDAQPQNERALAPVVGYSIEQLDPKTFASLKSLDVANQTPALKTGDVFAVKYSTSLPGQVRLENIDPSGVVNDLGTYTVTPDQLNRIPSNLGIKLVGQPGTEVIRFYFYPCLPSGSAEEAWAAGFKDRLPACGRGPNPVVLAAASGAIRPKSLVNLAQPDATMSFAGSADYRVNDITSTVALIQHEAP